MRIPLSIAIIFVKEWWNNTYSAGLFLFSLHCDLVPERTYCQHIAVINTRHLIWRVLFIFCLGFEKYQETKHFYGDQLLKSVSLFFVLCFLLESDFPGKVSGDHSWSSEMSSLHQVGWSRVSDIPCPPSLLSFFEPAVLHVGSTNLRE